MKEASQKEGKAEIRDRFYIAGDCISNAYFTPQTMRNLGSVLDSDEAHEREAPHTGDGRDA